MCLLVATGLVVSLQVVSLRQEVDSIQSVYHKEVAENQAGFRGDQCTNILNFVYDVVIVFIPNQKGLKKGD